MKKSFFERINDICLSALCIIICSFGITVGFIFVVSIIGIIALLLSYNLELYAWLQFLGIILLACESVLLAFFFLSYIITDLFGE